MWNQGGGAPQAAAQGDVDPKAEERAANDRFKHELENIGAPYTVICNSCDAIVFKIPIDDFERRAFGKEDIDTKK